MNCINIIIASVLMGCIAVPKEAKSIPIQNPPNQFFGIENLTDRIDDEDLEMLLQLGYFNDDIEPIPVSSLAPTGIVNTGSNCYAIATLQALLSQPFIVDKILNPDLTDPHVLKQEIIPLQEFTKWYFSENANPHQLGEKFAELRDYIFDHHLHPALIPSEKFEQQDAVDFCSTLLQIIGYSFDLHTITQGIYQGPETQGEILKVKTNRSETERLFSLGVLDRNQTKTMQQLILENISEKINSKENAWNVKTTDQQRLSLYEYERRYQIEGLPETIGFQIKRYGYDQQNGGTYRIGDDFPLESELIDLSELIETQTDDFPLYRLVSCINHAGTAVYSGHYTTYTRRGDQWYFCNDAAVRECSWDEVKEGKGYIFFFERVK